MTRDDRLRIAVFIDFDNIEIGVKNTLGANFDAGLVLEALKERGDVVSKTAYSDWQRAGGYSRSLTQHAIKMVQRNLTPGGDKNGADINLALDALEMAFTHPHINAFVIVGGDSDFISLVEKLKQYDKKVFVVGGRQFSSIIMQKNCHEFIAYENLVGATAPASGGGDRRQRGGRDVRVERQPIEQALPLVTRALKVLSEREVSPQLGLLKSTLLQLDSTFSERSYGAGSFRDFVEKLEKVGVVTLQQGKGGWLVSATEQAEAAAAAAAEAAAAAPGGSVTDDGEAGDETHPHAAPQGGERRGHDHGDRGGDRGGDRHDRGEGGHQGAAPAVVGSNADGIREFRKILATGQVRRWPMYLRNVKQVIRQVSTTFDERAYGFANLADLLRAAGREGIVRVDRDRQGVIRVFQGSAMPTMAEAQAPMRDKAIFDIEDELAAEAANAANGTRPGGSVVVDETVIVVDENAGTVSEYVVATHPAVSPAGDDDEDDESNGEVEEEEDDSQLVMLAKASAKSHAKVPAGRSRRPARGTKPAAAKEVRARAPRKRR